MRKCGIQMFSFCLHVLLNMKKIEADVQPCIWQDTKYKIISFVCSSYLRDWGGGGGLFANIMLIMVIRTVY